MGHTSRNLGSLREMCSARALWGLCRMCMAHTLKIGLLPDCSYRKWTGHFSTDVMWHWRPCGYLQIVGPGRRVKCSRPFTVAFLETFFFFFKDNRIWYSFLKMFLAIFSTNVIFERKKTRKGK